MAGTAEGAAKATAARLAKRAQRAQSNEQPSSAAGGSLLARSDVGDVGTAVALLPQTVGVPAAVLVPKALKLAEEVLDGKHKASAAVRANLAAEILRQASKPSAPPSPGAAFAEAVAALGKALGVRAPRTLEGAVTVVSEPVDAG